MEFSFFCGILILSLWDSISKSCGSNMATWRRHCMRLVIILWKVMESAVQEQDGLTPGFTVALAIESIKMYFRGHGGA